MKQVLDKIEKMDPEVRSNLELYLSTEEVQEMEVEGYTINKLKNERSMNPLAGYLSLDWLVREPEAAKKSFKEGSDKIT